MDGVSAQHVPRSHLVEEAATCRLLRCCASKRAALQTPVSRRPAGLADQMAPTPRGLRATAQLRRGPGVQVRPPGAWGRHLVEALEEFQALGVGFVSYSESLDTSTPMGRAMFAIVGALAQLERDILVERSVEGQRRARARGVHIGRPRRRVDEDHILRLRDEGLSLRAIARETGVSRTVVTRVVRDAKAQRAA